MKYSLKVSEQKNRRNFFLFEPILNIIKFFVNSKVNIRNKNLLYFYFFKNKNIFRTSVSFIHNRCVVTFRARSVFRLFKMSRHQIKQLGSYGRISGLKKSAW